MFFGLVLDITGLAEPGILPVWEQTEEDYDGDEEDMNSDPSPLGICT